MITRGLDRFERVVTAALLVMMAAVVLLAALELAWILVLDVLSPPVFLLEIGELLEIFGHFLLVLIGIELMHSLKIYMEQRAVHVQAVLTVALIAVARKIIVLDPDMTSPEAVLGIAAIVLALTLGLALLRRRQEPGR